MVLFTHLKIILLQCFLVFSFNFQLYPNGPLITFENTFGEEPNTKQLTIEQPRDAKTWPALLASLGTYFKLD